MLKTVRYIITYLNPLNIAYFRKYKAFFTKSHRKYITQINNALFKKRAVKARFPLLYYTLLNRVTPIYMVKIIKKPQGEVLLSVSSPHPCKCTACVINIILFTLNPYKKEVNIRCILIHKYYTLYFKLCQYFTFFILYLIFTKNVFNLIHKFSNHSPMVSALSSNLSSSSFSMSSFKLFDMLSLLAYFFNQLFNILL